MSQRGARSPSDSRHAAEPLENGEFTHSVMERGEAVTLAAIFLHLTQRGWIRSRDCLIAEARMGWVSRAMDRQSTLERLLRKGNFDEAVEFIKNTFDSASGIIDVIDPRARDGYEELLFCMRKYHIQYLLATGDAVAAKQVLQRVLQPMVEEMRRVGRALPAWSDELSQLSEACQRSAIAPWTWSSEQTRFWARARLVGRSEPGSLQRQPAMLHTVAALFLSPVATNFNLKAAVVAAQDATLKSSRASLGSEPDVRSEPRKLSQHLGARTPTANLSRSVSPLSAGSSPESRATRREWSVLPPVRSASATPGVWRDPLELPEAGSTKAEPSDVRLMQTKTIADGEIRCLAATTTTSDLHVAVGTDDGNLHVFNNTESTGIHAHARAITSVAFHPVNPAFLLTSSQDKSLRIVSTGAARAMVTWRGHTHTVHEARFAPNDHNMVVSASSDQSLKVWDMERTGSFQSTLNANAAFTSLAFANSGDTLLAGQATGAIRLYKMRTLAHVRTIKPRELANAWITSIDVHPSQDNYICVTTESENVVRLYDLRRDASAVVSYSARGFSSSRWLRAAFSPCGSYIVAPSFEGRAFSTRPDSRELLVPGPFCWHVNSGKPVTLAGDRSERVSALVWHPLSASETVLVTASTGAVRIEQVGQISM